MIFVSAPGVEDAPVIEDLASEGIQLEETPIQIISPDPTPLFEAAQQAESESEQSEDAVYTAGDPAVQSLLFGRYTSQIAARIQRAWRKPRTPVLEPVPGEKGNIRHQEIFRCQARIRQDMVGNVTEVELMRCDGTSDWQLSLVRAIQRASPLPAPPSPTVFTDVLTLSFEAREFVAGYREDEYEPHATQTAQR
jgi:hypothetical protein